MTELAPHTSQDYIAPPPMLSDEVRGISGYDIDKVGRGKDLLEQHLPKYDETVRRVHSFVVGELKMTDALPVERLVVVPVSQKEQRKMGTQNGGYQPDTDIGFVVEPDPDSRRPKTNKLQIELGLVHEAAHSASMTTETAKNIHGFFLESIAGLAESIALKKLAETGEYERPPHTVVTREVDGEELSILVPSEFRRVDASEVIDGQADSTQALLAALVVGIGLKKLGTFTASDILAAARRDNIDAYQMIVEAINTIEPGFADTINKMPNSTDGILKVVHRVQAVIGMTPELLATSNG